MTVTLSSRTEELLQEQARRSGQSADVLADNLLQDALQAAEQDFAETRATIGEGLADIEVGRTISFEQARAEWEAQKVAFSFSSSQ